MPELGMEAIAAAQRLAHHHHVAASMAAARKRMAVVHGKHEAQLSVVEQVLARTDQPATTPSSSREQIQSELARMLSVAKQLRENGEELQEHAQAAAEEHPPAPAAPVPGAAPSGGAYDGVQNELEALQVEAAEFDGELELLRRSVEGLPGDDAEASAVAEQARAKIAAMVRLHNETAQRHGKICQQLETKRVALETLQQQVAPPPAPPPAPEPEPAVTVWYYNGRDGETQGPQELTNMQQWYDHGYLPEGTMVRKGETGEFKDAQEFREITGGEDLFEQDVEDDGPRVLQVVVSGRPDMAAIVANQAVFGPAEVSVAEACCVQALPRVADSPLTNAQDVAGNIAVIDRGVVPVVEKARRAQQAGAVAVFLINSEDKPYAPSGHGADKGKDITIPVVTIPRTDGLRLQEGLPGLRCSAGFNIEKKIKAAAVAVAEETVRPQHSAASPQKIALVTSAPQNDAALRAAEAEILALEQEVKALNAALKLERASPQTIALVESLAANAALKKEVESARLRVAKTTAQCAALVAQVEATVTPAVSMRGDLDVLTDVAGRLRTENEENNAAGANDAAYMAERAFTLKAQQDTIASLSAELEAAQKLSPTALKAQAQAATQAAADAEAGLDEARQRFEREKGELLETVRLATCLLLAQGQRGSNLLLICNLQVADLRSEGVQMRVAQEEAQLGLEMMSKAVARAERSASEAKGSAVVKRLEQELADARADSTRLAAALDTLEAAATLPARRAAEGVAPEEEDLAARMRVAPPPITRPQPPPIRADARAATGAGAGDAGAVEQVSALQAKLASLAKECETVRMDRDAAKEREKNGQVASIQKEVRMKTTVSKLEAKLAATEQVNKAKQVERDQALKALKAEQVDRKDLEAALESLRGKGSGGGGRGR